MLATERRERKLLATETSQVSAGHLPKLLIDQILWYFIQANHCYSAINRRHSQGLLTSGTKWPIHILIWVQYSIIYFICLSISQATVVSFWSSMGTHTGVIKESVWFVLLPLFALRYGDIVSWPQTSCSVTNLHCDISQSFGLDRRAFYHFHQMIYFISHAYSFVTHYK